MKNERLRDGGATDPAWAAIERLCQSQPPTKPDPAMQARVLGRLDRPHRHALRLRPAFIALCVLLFAATASALWGTARRWLAPARPAATAPVPALPAPRAAAPASSSPSINEQEPSTAPAPIAVRAVVPPSRAQRRKSVAVAEHVADSVNPKRIEATTAPPSRPSPTLDPQESVLVHAAVRALRVDGRASRARALLTEYLSRFPQGALSEDAVALQIEAATAERDPVAARRWATRYLNDFPSGRFRAVADSVLHEDSSKESSGSRP